MRLNLKGATIFSTEYILSQCPNTIHEMEIKEGYMDISPDSFIGCLVQEGAKTEREKVWEMARKIVLSPDDGGMIYHEMNECFGVTSTPGILRMPVDEVLEKYESWKKKNDVEELIKSLKPQDVVAVPKVYERDTYRVYMVTMVNPYYEGECVIRGVDHTGDVILNRRTLEDYKGLKKIGRVVETTDILGEIQKIEDEWRKNRCGS